MKYFYVSLVLLLLGNSALAQVQLHKATPADFQAHGKFKTQKAPPAAVRLKEIDVPALLEEDKREAEQGVPPRFGKDYQRAIQLYFYPKLILDILIQLLGALDFLLLT